MPVIQVLEMMRQEDPWDLLAWGDCLAQSLSSRFSEKPLSQNKKGKKERDREREGERRKKSGEQLRRHVTSSAFVLYTLWHTHVQSRMYTE